MNIHPLAALTPKQRAYIHACGKSLAELEGEFPHVHVNTLRKWRGRADAKDRSHRPHRLALRMSALEEAVIVELRRSLDLPLDDLTEVAQRSLNPALSRSAIHRALARHGLSKRVLKTRRMASQGQRQILPFQTVTAPGFLHMDVKYLPRLKDERQLYLFVAIDRVSRFVIAQIRDGVRARDGAAFLEHVKASFPHTIHTILTDNGGEWTDRFSDSKKAKRPGQPSSSHPFDKACANHAIRHKLTRPRSPQTNGMVERFNRRIREALQDARRRFPTNQDLIAETLKFLAAYNHTRLLCLKHQSPTQVLNNHSGLNTRRGECHERDA